MPSSLAPALAVGICSKHATVRGCALRLAHELGDPARVAIAAARAGASPPDAQTLDEALAVLAGSALSKPASADDVELLDRLLEEWRLTHDPALEEPIVRLGAKLAHVRGALVARSKGELEGAWLALAAAHEVVDVSRLLAVPWPSSWRPTRARVQALAAFPADPRISLRLAEIARTFDSSSSQPLHRMIADQLARVPTQRLLALLDAIEAARPMYATDNIPLTKQTYAKVRLAVAELDVRPANAELLDLAQRASDPHELTTLFAQHIANPDDLAARAVLADALQLAGDPRGELITLQLAIAAGSSDSKTVKRADALLAEHGDDWTGPLPGVQRATRRFERGFLVAATSGADNDMLARSLDRPEWQTVEELTLSNPDCELAPFVGKLPLLRRLAATERALNRLVASGPIEKLRAVVCLEGWLPPPNAFPELVVAGGAWFRNDFDVARFLSVQRSAIDLGVQVLFHSMFPDDCLALALTHSAGGPPETRFSLDPFASGFASAGWRVRVRRNHPVVDLAVGARDRYLLSHADSLFAAIAAAGFKQVALHYPPELREVYGPRFEPAWHGIELLDGEPIDLAAPA
jgi:uncharacterized protein (TIGR02996 family)